MIFKKRGSVVSPVDILSVQNILFALPDSLFIFSSPVSAQEADLWGLHLLAPVTSGFLVASVHRGQGLEMGDWGRVRLEKLTP